MKALIYITLLILLLALAIQQTAKFILRKFFNEKPKEKSNPYIEYHKRKMANDEHYEDYLEWMKNKDVYGAPVKKVESLEEREANVKVRKLVPKR